MNTKNLDPFASLPVDEDYSSTVSVAAPIESLPALSVAVSGSISLTHNLERFGKRLTEFVGNLNSKPETDQDFADLDAAVKVLKEAEAALDSAEKNALAQTTTIADMCGLVEMYRKVARDNRLMFEKIVKQEKVNRKAAIISQASAALAAHITALNNRLGASYMPAVSGGFAESVAGLKSLDSMRDKVSAALANAKIVANEIADRIQDNRNSLDGYPPQYGYWMFLFPDFASVCTKARDDFADLLGSRIAAEEKRLDDAKKAEDARVAAAVEAERVRAAAEAAAKLTENNQTQYDDHQTSFANAAEAFGGLSGVTPEEKRAAVVEAQDDIADFINSRQWGREGTGKIRAVLVEYEAFKAGRGLAVAA